MSLTIKYYRLILALLGICLSCSLSAQQKSPVIAFASDTQAPMLMEKILLKPNHNLDATRMIFKEVVATRPASLFILGDVVALGYQDSKWRSMDAYLKACADADIPVYAALGNHELMFNAAKGERKFQTRFPMHNPAGYTEVVDSVAVILLNSNFSKMTKAEIDKQDEWYTGTIKKLDADPAVKLLIVGCHHSPYTNSKVVKPSVLVQQKFVPAFISSKKGALFLSGHSHNFERFKVQGKYFLVIGGGGGLHQPLRVGDAAARDISADYKPMFHYLTVQRHNDSLQIISRQLKPDFSGFTDGLVFVIGH